MKKKIVIAVIAVTLFVSPALARKVRVYDENSHYKGYVDNGRMYDENSHYKGRIEKSGRIYNEDSHYKGKIEKQKSGKKSHRSHEVEEEYSEY